MAEETQICVQRSLLLEFFFALALSLSRFNFYSSCFSVTKPSLPSTRPLLPGFIVTVTLINHYHLLSTGSTTEKALLSTIRFPSAYNCPFGLVPRL